MEQAQLKLSQSSMWIGLIEMTFLLPILIYLLCKVCRSKSFKFLVIVITLLILSDLAVMVLSVAFYFEQTDYLDNH